MIVNPCSKAVLAINVSANENVYPNRAFSAFNKPARRPMEAVTGINAKPDSNASVRASFPGAHAGIYLSHIDNRRGKRRSVCQ